MSASGSLGAGRAAGDAVTAGLHGGASPPTFAEVEAAAERLAGEAVRTPLLESAALNDRVGGRVLIKPETLQVTGSFKFRGAYNRLVQLSAEQRRAGVVAFSSGNHAQGVAEAARRLNMPALIVMPSDAPAAKVAGTRARGAEIRLYDRWTEDRELIAAEIARERGAVLVPSYDDPHIIAGQGTVGMEIAQQAQALGVTLDTVAACASGGGLMAGISLAMEALSPSTACVIAEPAGFDDHRLSLEAGERLGHAEGARSFCDALLADMPGRITFAVNRRTVRRGVACTDAEVAAAMRWAFETLKLVVEPGGAVALAALLEGRLDAAGKTTAVVLSGGNVDAATFAAVLTEGA